MDPDVEELHASIHAEYRQRLADAGWDAAVQRANVAARDKIITELRALLEPPTIPGA